MSITVDMVDAIRVQFLQPIFEEDFPEKGMIAWLTDIEWCQREGVYRLYFDFTEFEAQNMKYFKPCYHPNRHTQELAAQTGRRTFTAIEAGMYEPKYNVCFSADNSEIRNDEAFAKAIGAYLREVP